MQKIAPIVTIAWSQYIFYYILFLHGVGKKEEEEDKQDEEEEEQEDQEEKEEEEEVREEEKNHNHDQPRNPSEIPAMAQTEITSQRSQKPQKIYQLKLPPNSKQRVCKYCNTNCEIFCLLGGGQTDK